MVLSAMHERAAPGSRTYGLRKSQKSALRARPRERLRTRYAHRALRLGVVGNIEGFMVIEKIKIPGFRIHERNR
jgi:hypothetical protein